MTKILNIGTLTFRCTLVLKALNQGHHIHQNEEYGAHLIDPKDGEVFIIPRDVMEELIDNELIEFHTAN
jgi:hypothetical protein